MSVRCVPVSGAEAAKLVPILHDAEEDDERIRTAMRDPACETYAALVDEQAVGAAVVRWGEPEPAEILYLAVVASFADEGSPLNKVAVEDLAECLPVRERRWYKSRRYYFDQILSGDGILWPATGRVGQAEEAFGRVGPTR
ncbi:hypothetical protein FF36_05540 [Frankia torreyi]|uniref:Uncharacterized protein n=1 Tax=Frankia torreyi TaxID=1856 RepID=A0A0D8B9V6_9ACTN|nr:MULTISPECIES: hypothetical protein [Frankia]KJE20162.1 hypothetical protein FF36_05540 [Frankia torreyi]KQC35073.1 hypothetical protein UK82_28440 [Frankia sp. ACN1ag]KQM02444.1 hypothetical protein FF86_106714 [Frankia sp. CpI1-P]